MIFYNIAGTSLALLPQILRDALLVSTVIIFFLSGVKIDRFPNRVLFLFLFLSFAIVFSFGISFFDERSTLLLDGGSFVSTVLNNIRRFGFMLFILIFFSIARKYIDLKDSIVRYLYIFWLFGLFEYFMPTSFWLVMKLPEYWRDVVDSVAGSGDGILDLEKNGRMFTYDTVYLIGERSRRLISFYLEPTTTASLAVGSLFFSYLTRNYKLFFITTICGVLTFSKGFWLAFLILLGYIITSYIFRRKLDSLYVKGVALSFVTFLVLFYFLFIYNHNLFSFGFLAHLYGLYSYIENFRFWGFGLGMAGSFAVVDNPLKVGIESSLANIVSQSGILGFLYVGVLFTLLFKQVANHVVLGLLVVFYFFLFSTSNSAVAYSGNFLLFLIIAQSFSYDTDKCQ